jgi:hypothetical protein
MPHGIIAGWPDALQARNEVFSRRMMVDIGAGMMAG